VIGCAAVDGAIEWADPKSGSPDMIRKSHLPQTARDQDVDVRGSVSGDLVKPPQPAAVGGGTRGLPLPDNELVDAVHSSNHCDPLVQQWRSQDVASLFRGDVIDRPDADGGTVGKVR
jgi:hypothetical protein